MNEAIRKVAVRLNQRGPVPLCIVSKPGLGAYTAVQKGALNYKKATL